MLGLPGSPTGLSCPRCGGVLGEQAEGGELRLECRIGHVVVLDTLVTPELALATIAAVEVLGAFRAPRDVKAALASRTV